MSAIRGQGLHCFFMADKGAKIVADTGKHGVFFTCLSQGAIHSAHRFGIVALIDYPAQMMGKNTKAVKTTKKGEMLGCKGWQHENVGVGKGWGQVGFG